MAVLEILEFPDPRLRTVAEPVTEVTDELRTLVDDMFETMYGEEEMDEGCLSVPGFYETVNRPRRVRVTALDRNGESFTRELEGLLAICLQHEIDHLDGKLFVDYISPLKRQRIRKKLEKTHRRRA